MKKAEKKLQERITIELEDLEIFGIRDMFYNLSYKELYKHELDKKNKGFERGIKTKFGAVSVNTGKFTGRSPKDKYIVGGGASSENVWWSSEKHKGSDSKPISTESWHYLYSIVTKQLTNKDLYVMDGFSGASENARINVRLVTEIAWQAHFFKNMFIRPEEKDLVTFISDWTILSAS